MYNRAGLYTTVRSDTFLLPSKLPPSSGILYEVNASRPDDKSDMDYFAVGDRVCVRWEGFAHHKGVTFRVGVGTLRKDNDVLAFHQVRTNSSVLYCLDTSTLKSNTKYYTSIEASCSGGSTVGSSDGFMIIDPKSLVEDIVVLDGDDCSDVAELHVIIENKTRSHYVIQLNTTLNKWRTYTMDLHIETIRNISVSIEQSSIRKLYRIGNEHFLVTFSPTVNIHRLEMAFTDPVDFKMVTIKACSIDVDVQFPRNEINFQWKSAIGSQQMSGIYQVAIATKVNGSTQFVREFEEVIGFSNTIINNLALTPGVLYHGLVKYCVGSVCTEPIVSDGVVVYNYVAKELKLNANFARNESCGILNIVSRTTFKDPTLNINDVTTQWSLSKDARAASLYTQWTPCDASSNTVSMELYCL